MSFEHYGLSFSFEIDSVSFDEILERTEKIVKDLDEKTILHAKAKLFENKENLIGNIPFSLRKDKKGTCKFLKVDYDYINRKFWHGSINIEDILETQMKIISTMPDVEILDYDIEELENHLKRNA